MSKPFTVSIFIIFFFLILIIISCFFILLAAINNIVVMFSVATVDVFFFINKFGKQEHVYHILHVRAIKLFVPYC